MTRSGQCHSLRKTFHGSLVTAGSSLIPSPRDSRPSHTRPLLSFPRSPSQDFPHQSTTFWPCIFQHVHTHLHTSAQISCLCLHRIPPTKHPLPSLTSNSFFDNQLKHPFLRKVFSDVGPYLKSVLSFFPCCSPVQ